MKANYFKPRLLSLLISSAISPTLIAGHVRSDIDYQYFRDFAENKGKFTVGAHDIEIFNKQGESVGVMMKNGIPMLDLAVLSRSGVGTLVGDQYIISVAHNGGYGNVDYGAEGNNPDQKRYSYKLVNRNNYPRPSTTEHPLHWDYHQPRLNKLVTEVAPIDMVEDGNHGRTYNNLEKYPMRVRAGSGIQKVRVTKDKLIDIVRAYNYLTGGNAQIGGGRPSWIDMGGNLLTANAYGPMPIVGDQGDSGSPIFVYDKEKQKWFVNGVLNFGNGGQGNTYSITRSDFFNEIFDRDFAKPLVSDNANNQYIWRNLEDGTSSFTLDDRNITQLDINNGNNPDHGKNMSLIGEGIIELANSINQGAGGLYFEGDFTVQGQTDDITWLGAGVSISDESTVNWKIKNPKGDRLSKIGQGTLLVNGKGENPGDISVGDGIVILNQTTDTNGKQQAFANVQILSGRPTVTLAADNQVNPDNISFGFRGGRLDLNGKDITFNRIKNTDDGARIVNHHATATSTLTILGNAKTNNEKNIEQSKAIGFNGWIGETDSTRNNGRLNLIYQPTQANSELLLSGGMNLNGNVTQQGGTLVLSGRPTPHAYNHLNRPDVIDYAKGEVIFDDDWLTRSFKAENFVINGGSAVISRNVSEVQGNWQLSQQANATLGISPKEENLICLRSDWTGLTTCSKTTLSEKAQVSLPTLTLKGNINATDNANVKVQGNTRVEGKATLNKHSYFMLSEGASLEEGIVIQDDASADITRAHLNGAVTLTERAVLRLNDSQFAHTVNADADTTLKLSNNAHWTLPSSQTIGHLQLDNSQITLNTNSTPSTHNVLTIQGNLNGQGTFNYATNIDQLQADRVDVQGIAQGDFTLNVRNTGAEPNSIEKLTLLSLKNTAQPDDNLRVTLTNQYVDAGAYRYELQKTGQDYRLYNPRKEQELIEEERRIAEEKRIAAEKEAQRIAEEKRIAAEKEAQRIAEEKRIAAEKEAQRIAEEKRIAAEKEAQRIAEEKRKIEHDAQANQAKQKTLISHAANNALSEFASSLNRTQMLQRELHKHLINEQNSSVWANYVNENSRYDSDDYRAYQQQTHLSQFGVQHRDDHARVGMVLSQSNSRNTFDEKGGNSTRLTLLSAFGQYQFNNGLALQTNVGYGSDKGKFNDSEQTIKRRITTFGVGGSYALKLGAWQVKPNASIQHYRLSATNYRYQQTQVSTPAVRFNAYQVGIAIEYAFTPWKGVTMRPTLNVNYVDASRAQSTIYVNQAALSQRFDRYWQQEVGLSAQAANWQITLSAGQNRGKQLDKQRQFGVKLGYNW